MRKNQALTQIKAFFIVAFIISILAFFVVLSIQTARNHSEIKALRTAVCQELPNATYSTNSHKLRSVRNHVITDYTLITSTSDDGETNDKPKFNGNNVIVYAVGNVKTSSDKTVYSSSRAVKQAIHEHEAKIRVNLTITTIVAIAIVFTILALAILLIYR